VWVRRHGTPSLANVPTLERFSHDALRDTVITFRDTMKVHAPGINRLNVYPVPDGDTGTNMARTLDAVVAELEGAPANLASTCDAISHGSLMGARGNSGVILSQILRGMSNTLKEATEGTGAKVAEALKAASVAAYQAVLKPIEGTILTVVRESADAAQVAAQQGGSLVDVLRAAKVGGKSALDRTPDMLPVLKDAGVVDAGGAGFLLLLDSALHVVDGSPLPEPDEGPGPSLDQLDAIAHRHVDGEVDVSELRYEVMYFLDLDDQHIQALKAWMC
jgi:dihydroxyacetone kinase-like predicted kinase